MGDKNSKLEPTTVYAPQQQQQQRGSTELDTYTYEELQRDVAACNELYERERHRVALFILL